MNRQDLRPDARTPCSETRRPALRVLAPALCTLCSTYFIDNIKLYAAFPAGPGSGAVLIVSLADVTTGGSPQGFQTITSQTAVAGATQTFTRPVTSSVTAYTFSLQFTGTVTSLTGVHALKFQISGSTTFLWYQRDPQFSGDKSNPVPGCSSADTFQSSSAVISSTADPNAQPWPSVQLNGIANVGPPPSSVSALPGGCPAAGCDGRGSLLLTSLTWRPAA